MERKRNKSSKFAKRKAKDIKKTLKILISVLGGVLLLLALLFFVLKINKVQQFVVHSITEYVSEKVNAEVKIGRIDYKPFNTVSLYDIYVEDQQKDTLLYLKELNAHFHFFHFFKGKINFHSLEIIDFSGNIVLEKNGTRNFDFLIDAFASKKEKKEKKTVSCLVEQLKIENSSIRIRNLTRETQQPAGKATFNPNDIFFFNINADIILNKLESDSLNFQVQHFSVEENSGLKIKELKTKIAASTKEISTPKINLILEKSELVLDSVHLKYDSIADFKNFAEKVSIKANVKKSQINLQDISPFVADFKGLDIATSLEASFSGKISNLRVRDLNLRQEEAFSFKTDLDLNGLPDLEQTFLFANIRELYFDTRKLRDFVVKTSNKPTRLFDELTQLGTIFYQGNITGLFSNLVLFGKLKTDVGNVSTDILLKFKDNFSQLDYDGTIKSDHLKLGQLLKQEKIGDFSFRLTTRGQKKGTSPFNGIVNAKVFSASLNNYTYKDLEFEGSYGGDGFNGKLNVDDENIKAQFNGLIDLTKKQPRFNFELLAKDVNLHALNLTDKYSEGYFSFRVNTSMTGASLDDINGFINFDSIRIKNKEDELLIDRVLFVSHTEKNYTSFSVKSRYLNGSLHGNFQYSALPSITTQFLKKYLPALEPKQKTEKSVRIDLDLRIENTRELSSILEFPFFVSGMTTVKGFLDGEKEIIDVMTKIPIVDHNGKRFKSSILRFGTGEDKFEIIAETDVQTKNDFWNFSLYSEAKDDELSTNIEWKNRQTALVNKGAFKTKTKFSRDIENKIKAFVSILPTELVFHNSLWDVEESSVDIDSDKVIKVNNFRVSHEHRQLSVNGTGSKNLNDSISVELNEIDLSIISVFANMGNFKIAGKATGAAVIYSLLERPVFNSRLSVEELALNERIIGDAKINSRWEQEHQQLLASVLIDSKGSPVATGECTYSPESNRLDAFIDAQHLDLSFLTSFFETVIPHLRGYGAGKMYIGGPLDAIRFDGSVMVSGGEIKIGVLGTTYYFNDIIVLKPQEIQVPKVTLSDSENNKATLSGFAKHNGDFKNFVYNVSMKTKNIEVLNLAAGENDFCFGKAYAAANVHIFGDESEININVNGQTKPGTKVVLQLVEAGKLTDDAFIQYVVHHEKESESESFMQQELDRKKINVKLDAQIEATPDAEVEFLIDPSGGDMISGNGRGNIRLYFDDTQSDMKMYGSYSIDNGNYLFTMQDVFRKEFKIESGSTIRWSGDPLKAKVDIRAIYSLTASLKDLMDETLLHATNRMSVPVNCILILKDDLMSPKVSFDITLPSSDEGIKQIVRNIINTEEMMMRQIVYLLLFNRFYTPLYLRSDDTINKGTQEFLSLASSTLSSHLNHIMAQFSDTFTFGFDVRRTDDENMEYQTDFLYQPNRRWLVNGKFGVRDNNKMLENYNRFITDIDIEYLLSKSGKLRLKVYNHTIDRAQLRTAKNTQGIGFVYKEDFNTFKEMFQYYWSVLKGVVQKKSEDETEK